MLSLVSRSSPRCSGSGLAGRALGEIRDRLRLAVLEHLEVVGLSPRTSDAVASA